MSFVWDRCILFLFICSQESCFICPLSSTPLFSIQAVDCRSEVHLCWALPASQLGSLSKRDVCQVQYHCVCRHHRSLPSPEVGCQCKCHVNMTFTSLESGKGLATDTFSYLVSSISNWASWIFRLKNSIRKWYLMYLNLSLPSSKKGEIHRLQDKP